MMQLKDARRLRDEIRREGLHSVTPTGHGPDGYFARIWGINGQTDFYSRKEWLKYRVGVRQRREAGREAAHRLFIEGWTTALTPRPRSPIELMIDRACGLT